MGVPSASLSTSGTSVGSMCEPDRKSRQTGQKRRAARSFSTMSRPIFAHFTPFFACFLRLNTRKPESAGRRRKCGERPRTSGWKRGVCTARTWDDLRRAVGLGHVAEVDGEVDVLRVEVVRQLLARPAGVVVVLRPQPPTAAESAAEAARGLASAEGSPALRCGAGCALTLCQCCASVPGSTTHACSKHWILERGSLPRRASPLAHRVAVRQALGSRPTHGDGMSAGSRKLRMREARIGSTNSGTSFGSHQRLGASSSEMGCACTV
eukprot:COSAG04_NODE_413_length_14740_cov_85.508572_15_plen_266_part_00